MDICKGSLVMRFFLRNSVIMDEEDVAPMFVNGLIRKFISRGLSDSILKEHKYLKACNDLKKK